MVHFRCAHSFKPNFYFQQWNKSSCCQHRKIKIAPLWIMLLSQIYWWYLFLKKLKTASLQPGLGLGNLRPTPKRSIFEIIPCLYQLRRAPCAQSPVFSKTISSCRTSNLRLLCNQSWRDSWRSCDDHSCTRRVVSIEHDILYLFDQSAHQATARNQHPRDQHPVIEKPEFGSTRIFRSWVELNNVAHRPIDYGYEDRKEKLESEEATLVPLDRSWLPFIENPNHHP